MQKLSATKTRIIQTAISLYNEHGMFHVLNQDIAEAADISLSNFNYHFPKKKDLIFTVCGYLSYVLHHRIKQNSLLTNDGIILELNRIFLQFEHDFRFFYLDTHNILRTHPDLKKEMELQVKQDIQMIKNLNYIAIGKGYMELEPTNFKGLYDIIANQIWMISHFWYAQSTLKKEEGNILIQGLEQCYAILYPHLTPLGKEVYSNFIKEQAQ